MAVPKECPACGGGVYSYFGTLDNPISLNFICGAMWMPTAPDGWRITCPEAFAVLCLLNKHNNQLWQEVINWRPE